MSGAADHATSREERAAAAFRRLLVGVVAAGLLVLLGASVATVVLVGQNEDSTHWVNHTYQVEHELSGVRVALEKGEAARRGFLITGDGDYLATYRTTVGQIGALEERLQALTTDNPRQQAAVLRLQDLVRRKLDEDAAGMQGSPGERMPANLIRGDQAAVDQIRQVLATMVDEERRLLGERTDAQAANAGLLLAVVLASGVMLALLAASAFLLLRRYAADLGRSQSELQRMNIGLEGEVRRRTADLTLANDEIQRFAYIVSHDLRSPLVNVMGFTSELETALKSLRELAVRLKAEAPHLLSKGAAEAVDMDLPESIGFIRTSTQKMDRLINAILRLSREGRRTLTPETIAMPALFDGIVRSLKQQTEDKGATVEVEGVLPDLVNDRLAVEQVFSNVVENALKYLKPGRPGAIRIRGRSEGAVNVYEVEDNGRGIDPKDHERVFELFRRAGPQDQPGEGIGLAHVRALVYRLGGTITVDSGLDRGATFRVCLPPVLPRTEKPK